MAGQVTPAVGVGGTLIIVLNWEHSESPSADTAPLTATEKRMLEGAKALSLAIAPALEQDSPDKKELLKKGFVLDEVHVGMGISVGGDIGLVQADAQAFGKLSFTKADPGPTTDAVFIPSEPAAPVNLIVPGNRSQNGLFKLDPKKFSVGLQNALHMASFFAARAQEVSSAVWKIQEIEVGFTTSIAGDLQLVTAAGSVQVEMAFHPPGEK